MPIMDAGEQVSPALKAAQERIRDAFEALPEDSHPEVYDQLVQALAHAQLANDPGAVRRFLDSLFFTADMYGRGAVAEDKDETPDVADSVSVHDVIALLRRKRGAARGNPSTPARRTS
jgi:hypothetical protein